MKNLAQIIYGAYPDTDVLPIDPAADLKSLAALDKAGRRPGGHGDGLFSFIVAEALEAEAQSRGLCTATAEAKAHKRRQTLGRLAAMLDRAGADLEAVRAAVDAETGDPVRLSAAEVLRRLVNWLEADPDCYQGDTDGTLKRLTDLAKTARA